MRACDNSARLYYHPGVKSQKGGRIGSAGRSGDNHVLASRSYLSCLPSGARPARRQASGRDRLVLVGHRRAALADSRYRAVRLGRTDGPVESSSAAVGRTVYRLSIL